MLIRRGDAVESLSLLRWHTLRLKRSESEESYRQNTARQGPWLSKKGGLHLIRVIKIQLAQNT